MASVELIVMLSEMSTNHHTSGGFQNSVLLVQNFYCPWNVSCWRVFLWRSSVMIYWFIFLLIFLHVYVFAFTKRLWVPTGTRALFSSICAPNIKTENSSKQAFDQCFCVLMMWWRYHTWVVYCFNTLFNLYHWQTDRQLENSKSLS